LVMAPGPQIIGMASGVTESIHPSKYKLQDTIFVDKLGQQIFDF
jgi:hypothetical protein